MVVTNDAEVYSRVEMLRRHGGKVKYHHSELGLNSRLDALQAAILRTKLRHLDSWNRSRRENAYRYNQLLTDVPGVQSPREISSQGVTTPSAIREQNDRIEPVYHQYTVLVQDRDTVQATAEQRRHRHGGLLPCATSPTRSASRLGVGTRSLSPC